MSKEHMLKVHDLLNDEMYNKGNLDVTGEIYAADYLSHAPPGPDLTGHEAQRQHVSAIRAGFPDIDYAVDDRFTAGDRLVVRWTARGTHQGKFMGIPPTGKRITITGITIHRFAGGKIQESWNNWDALGMLRQLGVIPPRGSGEE